jgi:hypothetical protein
MELKDKATELHPNSVWLHSQIKSFISDSKNPERLRVARLISYLEQNVEIKRDYSDSSSDDESEDIMEEEEMEV